MIVTNAVKLWLKTPKQPSFLECLMVAWAMETYRPDGPKMGSIELDWDAEEQHTEI